jgi:hypothetical protein
VEGDAMAVGSSPQPVASVSVSVVAMLALACGVL